MAKNIVGYKRYLKAKNLLSSKKRYSNVEKAINSSIKNSTRKGVINTARGIVNNSIFAGVSGGFISFGRQVFVNLKNIDKRLDSGILDDQRVHDVMNIIKLEAQSNTPVDKRFLGSRKKLPSIEKDFSIPVSPSLKKREESYFTAKDEKISLLSPKYSIERQKQIVQNILGNRKLKRALWFEPDKESGFGHINFYRTRKKNKKGGYDNILYEKRNIRVATAFSDNRLHYGEEELKRSALYDEENNEISFDPTRLGTKYNYASLQHDRLDFKHKQGMALFLYKAYTKNQNKLLKVLNEVATEKLSKKSYSDQKAEKFDISRDVPKSIVNKKKQSSANLLSSLKRTLKDISRIRR